MAVVFGVQVIDQPVIGYHEECLDAVQSSDLFPFLVGSPVIRDGHLVNAQAALGHLGGYLRLDAEAVAAQRDALEDVQAESLVPSLHVGQVQVRGQVGEQGQDAVD